MSDIAIRVEHLGKRYRIGQREPYKALRDVISSSATRTMRWLASMGRPSHNAPTDRTDTFWALKDVSFEVKQGEVVGIIGHNGAGKSTLLKILSRITKPTEGRAEIHGRVGSLLEVGTGFHPELTGRENIYLNGAILGMRRAEIQRKFDEIVAFAEIAKFLDTPVKRYSSGMYVRLAFAVAAHLEPEILLVDEVLAVGDVRFQQKCLGKMGEVAKQGRTVMFVSHNMTAISNLCQSVAVLNGGHLTYRGGTNVGIDSYLKGDDLGWRRPLAEQIARLAEDPILRLIDLRVAQEGSNGTEFFANRPVSISIVYEVHKAVRGLRIGFDLRARSEGCIVFRTFHDDSLPDAAETRPGRYVSEAIIPPNFLAPLSYNIDLAIGVHNVRWIVHEQVNYPLDVLNVGGLNAQYADRRPGVVMPEIQWHTLPECAVLDLANPSIPA